MVTREERASANAFKLASSSKHTGPEIAFGFKVTPKIHEGKRNLSPSKPFKHTLSANEQMLETKANRVHRKKQLAEESHHAGLRAELERTLVRFERFSSVLFASNRLAHCIVCSFSVVDPPPPVALRKDAEPLGVEIAARNVSRGSIGASASHIATTDHLQEYFLPTDMDQLKGFSFSTRPTSFLSM